MIHHILCTQSIHADAVKNFNILKSNFIYFNTQFYTTLCIHSFIFTISQTLYLFLLISFSYSPFSSLPRSPTKRKYNIYFFMLSCYNLWRDMLLLLIGFRERESNVEGMGTLGVGLGRAIEGMGERVTRKNLVPSQLASWRLGQSLSFLWKSLYLCFVLLFYLVQSCEQNFSPK